MGGAGFSVWHRLTSVVFHRPGALVFRKNLWKNYGEEVAEKIKSIDKLCIEAEKEADLAVKEASIRGLKRQEAKADDAQTKANVAYEKQDTAHSTIIGNQERQGM